MIKLHDVLLVIGVNFIVIGFSGYFNAWGFAIGFVPTFTLTYLITRYFISKGEDKY